ncbi:MAG: periplasmic heavy metal sensor [Pseudomonadota bacterium]
MRVGFWFFALAILLALSLALNAFLLGAASARREAGPVVTDREAQMLAQAIRRMIPAEMRADFRSALRQDRRGLLADLQTWREARAATVAALHAEPLDRGAAEAGLAEMRRASVALQERLHAAALEAAEAAPPEVRRQIPAEGPRGALVRERVRRWLGGE